MGTGNDFTKNPRGNPGTSGGGQPNSYGESRPQRSGGDPDINPAEIPAGGKDLYADNVPAQGEEAPGVGSIGNSGVPFKGLS